MVSIDELRAEYYEALIKRGDLDAMKKYLGFLVHAAIREALDDLVVRQLLSRDEEKENDTPPWVDFDEHTAADDILRLACTGYVFLWNSAIDISHRGNAAPKVNMKNIIRTVKRQPAKLAALLVEKLERINGCFPETLPDEVAYRIDDGSTTEGDVWALSRALMEAVYEGEDTPTRKQGFVPPWQNPDEKIAADDLLRLAAAGFAYRGNSIVNLVGLTETTPRVDFMNLQRVIEEKRLKLAVLIVKKLFQLGGGAPDEVLPRMGCGDCEEEDIYKLSEALVFATSEN